MNIGFVGCGNLGRPMAARAAGAGWTVRAFDVNPAAVGELTGYGVQPAGSLAELARTSDVVISVLPDTPDVEQAVLSDDGVRNNIRDGATYIEMSTIDPATVRRVGSLLNDKGVRVIDAPVTRSIDHAWRGELALLVGGDVRILESVRPILDRFASLITHCGPLGCGAAMKLVNNYMAAGILAVVSEALGLGLKSGVTLETIMSAVSRSGTSNKLLLEVLPARAFNGDFSAGFRCALACKDQRLALAAAHDAGLETPIGEVVFGLLQQAAAESPNDDFTALLRLREKQGGFAARLTV